MLLITDILADPDYQFFDRVTNLADDYCREMGMEFDQVKLSAIQSATQEISAPAFHEIFSIRELLKLHYLHSSDLLLRPLLERIATISYLRKSDESALRLWESGWNDPKNRPSAKVRIDQMDELKNPFTGSTFTLSVPYSAFIEDYRKNLHSLVHGDRSGSYRNNAIDSNGREFFASGPNPHNPEATARIATMAATLTSYLIQEIKIIFPNVASRMLGKQS